MTFEEWVSATSKGASFREQGSVKLSYQGEDNPYEDFEEEEM